MPFSQTAAATHVAGTSNASTLATRRSGRHGSLLPLLTALIALGAILAAALEPSIAVVCGRYENFPCGP